jgi:TetR/AcrR family transcriptional regulator
MAKSRNQPDRTDRSATAAASRQARSTADQGNDAAPSRAPGRPTANTADHRAALLDAAQAIFARAGFAASSLRTIAREARVTPALAHYYFLDKGGLLTAVIEERVAPLVAAVISELESAGEDPLAAIRAFVVAYTRTAANNPWLPRLVMREVLSEEGVLREAFIQRFARGIAGALRRHLAQGKKLGLLRADLDVAATVMSIMSLCIFPYIAAPLVSDVLGIRLDPARASALSSHHLGILMNGVQEST